MAQTRSLFLQSVRAPRDFEHIAETTNAITRARILQAMAAAVAEHGYASVTVADVVKAGRISRRRSRLRSAVNSAGAVKATA